MRQYDSVISELFNEAASQFELIQPDKEEYKEAWNKKERMEQLLLKTFSTEQKAMYDALDSAWVEVSSIFDEAVFRRGVSLGVRITAESFLFER